MQPLTDLDWLSVGQDWPPKSQRERLAMYAANRKLFEGQHDKVFTDWPRLLREDMGATLEMVLNWPKRLSTLWADLLAGDPPTFTVGAHNQPPAMPPPEPNPMQPAFTDESGQPMSPPPEPPEKESNPEQDRLDAIVERNQFATLVYDVAIDISRYGDGLFKITLDEGEAKICGQSPVYWFPVTSIADVRYVRYHVLAWPFTLPPEADPNAFIPRSNQEDRHLLKVEIHEPGAIHHRVLVLGKNKKIEGEEDPRAHFPDLPAVSEETGIDDFLVQQAPGLRPIDRLFGLNDYTDLESIVQEMEVRIAQMARILDKHADPSMFGPSTALEVDRRTGEAKFVGGGKFFPLEEGDTPPGYLTWDGALASAFQELEELKQQFWLVTETSPAAFGQIDAALATSGTALRRLMQAPLAKARRLRMRLDPVCKQTLRIAYQLEEQGGTVSMPGGNAAA